MLFYCLDTLTTRWSSNVKVFRYPYVENSLHVWTKLNDMIIKKDDIVVLGYVSELKNCLGSNGYEVISEYKTSYYTSTRLKIANKVINLLGVKYSFWGNLSAKIVNRVLGLGASEIIYFGKLGTLDNPEYIYNKLYSPTQYSVVYHDKLVCQIDDLENNIAKVFPELNTGMHTSVPTILEEDYMQREILNIIGSKSIDNEISQIAYTVKKFNLDFRANIPYSCIHFATDYVRQLDKPDVPTPYDLSNNRSDKAKEKKNLIIQKACEYLLKYFNI